ncbi:hypothetical protein Kyoto47B_12240 [Helicobacter pylori]
MKPWCLFKLLHAVSLTNAQTRPMFSTCLIANEMSWDNAANIDELT